MKKNEFLNLNNTTLKYIKYNYTHHEMSNNVVLHGGANRLHTAFFCSECGNLYDITNTPPTSDTTTTKKEKSEKVEHEKIYFVCTTCGNTEKVKPRTLLVSKKSQEMAKDYFGNYSNPEYLANSPTLPHTRDYICPNAKCKTHAEPNIRDAVMSRIGNSYKMMYVCTICKKSWK
jgi:DNA-directed RNA polymerase subunit M/transcription elongation factor TFIIS